MYDGRIDNGIWDNGILKYDLDEREVESQKAYYTKEGKIQNTLTKEYFKTYVATTANNVCWFWSKSL